MIHPHECVAFADDLLSRIDATHRPALVLHRAQTLGILQQRGIEVTVYDRDASAE